MHTLTPVRPTCRVMGLGSPRASGCFRWSFGVFGAGIGHGPRCPWRCPGALGPGMPGNDKQRVSYLAAPPAGHRFGLAPKEIWPLL